MSRLARGPSVPRPDASMSLLTDLLHEPGDAEYVEAARRRTTRDAPPRRPLLSAGVLLVVGLLLAAGVVEWRSQSAAVATERSGLAQRIRAETAQSDALAARAAALDAEVARLRDSELRGQAAGDSGQRALATLGVATGTAPATGPGLTVSLSDAPPGSATAPGCESGRILDVDLVRLVNGLWAAGAEAVAVDGQRLTAQTAIRSAAEAILVGYRPIDPPYSVSAIGDPRSLEARLASGEAGTWFATLVDLCGVGYRVAPEDSLLLPGAAAPVVAHATPASRAASRRAAP